MIPAGYLYKRISPQTESLKRSGIANIFSLSGCMSKDFLDYVQFWKHNRYWLFDTPDAMKALALQHSADLSQATLFYYEAYEREYDEETRSWSPLPPEPTIFTDVRPPEKKSLQGFDVVCCGHMSPGCSPLSCNGIANEVAVNRHCLFDSLDQAKQALETGKFEKSEPGPYRIFAVYTMP